MRITRKIPLVLLTALLAAALSGCSTNAVAKVNGEAITQDQFDSLYAQAQTSMGGIEDTATMQSLRIEVLDYLIESAVVRQEAELLGADLSDEAVESRIEELRGDLSAEEYETQLTEAGYTMEQLETSVIDQLAREALSAAASEDTGTVEIPEDYALLEHILVSGEETATVISEQLASGADFATLAATYSEDAYSAAYGGSLDWAPYSDYVVEFADAARTLAVGAISAPVESDYGWHIIRKVAEAAAGTLLSEAPQDLQDYFSDTGTDLALAAYIERLRDAAEIEYLDESLKPAESSAE
jgi:parvulin-like peptidyl-prolyl isomerase